MELTKWLKEMQNRKHHKSFRIRAIIILAEFLAIMVLLTIVARGIYSSYLPSVTIESPRAMNLLHKVEAVGVAQQERESNITAAADILVDEIYVQQGDIVAVGDTLFAFDIMDLNERIQELEYEIKRLDLQIKMQESEMETAEQQKRNAIERAAQDHTLTEREMGEQIKDTLQELNNAKNEKGSLGNENDYINAAENSDVQLKNNSYRIQSLEKEIADIEKKITETDITVSGNDLVKNDWILKKEEKRKELLELKDQTENYRAALRSSAKEAWNKKKQELEDSVLNKENEYQKAALNQEKAILGADRQIQDAQALTTMPFSVKLAKLEKEHKVKELQKYQKISHDQGIIKSEKAGCITKVNIISGERSGNNAAFLIANQEETIRFSAIIDNKDLKYAAKGDEVLLKLYSGNRSVDGLKIERIEPIPNSESYRINVEVPSNEVSIGENGKLVINKTSENYAACIPLEAIYTEELINFCYVLKVKEGFMGEEWCVEKRNVKIIDKNEKYAALEEGNIEKDEKIILRSDRELKHNSVVRPDEG